MTLGPSGLALGPDELLAMRDTIRAALNLPQSVHWAVSLAGCEHTGAREALLDRWEEPLLLLSDRDAAWLGACEGEPGAVLTIGTGTALAWRTQAGMYGHAGGLGFELGDEGSGAWIGRMALARLARALDGESGIAIEAWADGLGVPPHLSDLMGLASGARASTFAARAPWVLAAARRGDLEALAIREAAICALERLLARIPEPLPLMLLGGLSTEFSGALAERGHPVRAPRGDVFAGLAVAVTGFHCPGLPIWRRHV